MMTDVSKSETRVLAIDPTTKGFGFAVMEGLEDLVDWGVRTALASDRNVTTLELIWDLIERYRPEIIVIQDCRSGNWGRCERVKQLLGDVSKLALREKITVRLISRGRMKVAFAALGARTKHEIATVIARRLPELGPRQPRYRHPWMSEDYSMSIFDAVALALTYYFERERRVNNYQLKKSISRDVQNNEESEDLSH